MSTGFKNAQPSRITNVLFAVTEQQHAFQQDSESSKGTKCEPKHVSKSIDHEMQDDGTNSSEEHFEFGQLNSGMIELDKKQVSPIKADYMMYM